MNNNGSPLTRALAYVAILFGLPIFGLLYLHGSGHIPTITVHDVALSIEQVIFIMARL